MLDLTGIMQRELNHALERLRPRFLQVVPRLNNALSPLYWVLLDETGEQMQLGAGGKKRRRT